jgi:hypothetical protein
MISVNVPPVSTANFHLSCFDLDNVFLKAPTENCGYYNTSHKSNPPEADKIPNDKIQMSNFFSLQA